MLCGQSPISETSDRLIIVTVIFACIASAWFSDECDSDTPDKQPNDSAFGKIRYGVCYNDMVGSQQRVCSVNQLMQLANGKCKEKVVN